MKILEPIFSNLLTLPTERCSALIRLRGIADQSQGVAKQVPKKNVAVLCALTTYGCGSMSPPSKPMSNIP